MAYALDKWKNKYGKGSGNAQTKPGNTQTKTNTTQTKTNTTQTKPGNPQTTSNTALDNWKNKYGKSGGNVPTINPSTVSTYSDAVKYLQTKGDSSAAGIMTEHEWNRRKGNGDLTYQDYLRYAISDEGTLQRNTGYKYFSEEVNSLKGRLKTAYEESADKATMDTIVADMDDLYGRITTYEGYRKRNNLGSEFADMSGAVDTLDKLRPGVNVLSKYYDRYPYGKVDTDAYEARIKEIDGLLDEKNKKYRELQDTINLTRGDKRWDSEHWTAVSEQGYVYEEIDALEKLKKAYKKAIKSGNAVNEDDFFGQFGANFTVSGLSRSVGKSANAYLDNRVALDEGTDEDPWADYDMSDPGIARAVEIQRGLRRESNEAQQGVNWEAATIYNDTSKRYQANNREALDDEGQVLPWISKNAASYLPQLVDQTKAKIAGTAGGFVAGMATGNPALATKTAAAAGSAAVGIQEYEVMRGTVYMELIDAGYDHDTALAAANDEALISGIIEAGSDLIGTVVSKGVKALEAIGGVAKKTVAKGTASKATEHIAKTAADKAAKAVSKTLLRRGAEFVGRTALNAGSEYLEEFSQQGVSIKNRERLENGGEGGAWNLAKGTAKTIGDAITGKNPEALAQMHEAGKAGAITGGMFGTGSTVTNMVVIRLVNAKTISEQNKFIDAIREDSETLDALIEEGKASGDGTVSAKVAKEVEKAKEKGAVSRDQVKRLVAANEVYIANEETAEATRAFEQSLGKSGKKQFARFLNEVGEAMTGEVLEGFSRFYEAGKNGLTLKQAQEANSYYLENFPKDAKSSGKGLLNSAFFSGQNDRENGISAASQSFDEAESSRKGDTLEDSSIVLERDENKYPYNEQEVIEGYEDAVDNRIMLLAEKIRKGQYKENDSVEFGKTGSSEIQAVSKILGIDVSGYDSVVEARQIRHIITRHGINGKADKSMRNDEDIARLKFVIDNYDDAFYGGTSSAYTTIKQNGKPREADTVVFAKKINGTYFVVQAVPQTKKKKLFVVSAFISDKTLDEIKEQFFNKKQKNRTSRDASLRQSSKTSVVTSEAAPSENSNDPGVQNQKKDSSSLVGTNSSADISIPENGTVVKRENNTGDKKGASAESDSGYVPMKRINDIDDIKMDSSDRNVAKEIESNRSEGEIDYDDNTPDIGDIKKATGFGDEGAQLVAELMSKGKSLDEAQKAVKPMYIAGFTGGDVKRAKTDIQKRAFDAGTSDKVAQREAARSKAKKATVRDGSLIENEASGKLSKVDREIIKTVAKDLGLSASVAEKIVVARKNGVEYEADARHRDGELTLTGARPVFRLVLHEAGHRMEQFATEEWNTLCEALYERAEQLGRRMDLGVTDNLRFDRVKGLHDKAGITKDTSGYVGEVVMRELETIFSSPKEYNKWLSEISSDRKVKSAWRKFMDFVSGLFGKVRNALKNVGLSKDARARMKSELAELERIKGLYAQAYKATRDAVEQRRKDSVEVRESDVTGEMSFLLSDKNGNIKKEYHHFYNEDTVDKSFLTDVNKEIENAIINIRLGNLKEVPNYIKVTTINETSIKKISNFVGFDISGYKCVIERDRLLHIDTRHGVDGKQDDSMSDPKDIARMGWAVNNITAIEWQLNDKGEKVYDKKYNNKNNTSCPVIVLRSKIDGTYCLGSVVPDTSKKILWVTSARIEKADESQVPNGSGATLQQTSKTPLDNSSASADSILSSPEKSNEEIVNNEDVHKSNYSIKEEGITTSDDTKELLNTIADLKHEFEITKFAKADTKEMLDTKFSYDSLTSLPDMEVPVIGSETDIKFTDTGNIDKSYIFKTVRDKCEQIITKKREPTYVTDVPALGGKVEITGDGIKHGFNDGLKKGKKSVPAEITARAELMLPEILKNSIEVNRKAGRDSETSYSSVLLGTIAIRNDSGNTELYAVRSVVEMGKNKTPALIEYGVVGSLYAANAKKTADIDHDWFDDDSSPRPVRRPRKLSISQLLDSVKGVFDDTLSNDVYEHFGMTRRKGGFADGLNYSLKDNNDTAKADTRELLDTIAQLKHEFEITKFAKADPKKLSEMVRSILKDYSSKADSEAVMSAVDELYTYMANGVDGNPPVWNEVYSRALDIANGIVENAVKVDDTAYREYADLRNYLRNVPMKFDVRYDGVPSGYSNFNEFRKKNFGRLRFSNDGLSVDSIYQELAEMYPQFFDKDNEITTADQLERIVEVLDEIRPIEANPFAAEMKDATRYLANDILDRFFDIPQAKPTFADKAERRVLDAKIEGQRKVEKAKAQRDIKIQKLRDNYGRIIQNVKDEKTRALDKQKAKHNESLAKMSESRRTTEMRTRIFKHASELNQRLVHGTDNKHIPQELQGAVLVLLESINLESNIEYVYGKDAMYHRVKRNTELGGESTKKTQAFNALRDIYSKLEGYVVIDPDLLGPDGILSEVINLADKRITDMTIPELNTVWKAIKAIEASVRSADKMFSAGKFRRVSDAAEGLRADNADKSAKKDLRYGAGLQKLIGLDMLTPETYFHYLGDTGDQIFRMMRDAQDKHISIMKEVADFTHEAMEGVNIKKLEKELKTVKLGGKEVTLTTAQLMELYTLMKRSQAKEHVFVGGILPDTIKGHGLHDIKAVEPVTGINQAEILDALMLLTEDQRKLADKLQEYASTVLGKYGNEASLQVYNYEKFHEKNYWPIRTNKQEISTDIEKDTAVSTVANKGMAKVTVPDANTSLRIGSIFDTFASHASDMATYAAWLGTTEDINRIRNFVFWEDGVRTGTVKGILGKVHGSRGAEYLQNLLADISVGVKSTNTMNPFEKLMGNYKAASIGSNFRVIIQQPTAILRAVDMMGAQWFAPAFVKNPLKGWDKAKKYAPIAQWKDWGYFDINTGRQMKDVLFDNASTGEKIKQFEMSGAGLADSISWGFLWNAVEAEIKSKHKGLEVESEAYYKAVAERFTEVTDHTQVVDGIMQRSQIMRSGDTITKMATSFMGEPTKQYNMVASSLYDVINKSGKGKTKAIKHFGRMALALAISGVVNSAAQSIIDAMRDDDKEKKYWERWLTAFPENLKDTVNVVNYIPFVKDIVSIVQGYDVKRMDMETIAKTYKACENMIKSLKGEGKNTILESSLNLFAELARLGGYSVSNIKRMVTSIADTFAIETDNYLMQYHMEKAVLDINFAGNRSSFIDILYNAYNNDREAYEIIYNDLIENGITEKQIQSGMETRMKNAAGISKVSDLDKRYMSPDDERKYDSILEEIQASEAWKSANKEQRKNAEADLFAIIASTSDDMEKKRKETAEYGVDETEYVLWQLAKDMADDANDNNGSMNAKEKGDAIGMLPSLGDSEIAYFYATEGADKVYETGMDMRSYAEFKGATADIKGDGKKNAIADTILQMDVDDDAAWDLYLTEYDNKSTDYARDNGIEGNTYLKFVAALCDVDKPTDSGKYGTYTQDEAKEAINSIPGLTREEKAILWQSVNPQWKEKNNPFR